jgi:hypothetical protein
MFNLSHPGDLIRESLDGLREETGKLPPLADVAERLGTTSSIARSINLNRT